MADSNAIPPALAAELKERFSDPELVELTFLIGYINMLNLFNNCLDVRYHGEYALLTTPTSTRPPRPRRPRPAEPWTCSSSCSGCCCSR